MVVRVYRTSENGGTFMGTAFFVAPKRLVTCAHVAVDERMRLVAEDNSDLAFATCAHEDRGPWRKEGDPREGDWAILEIDGGYRCARPLIRGAARDTDKWRARGFSKSGAGKAMTLGGDIMEIGSLIELVCTQTLDCEFDPRGASGSPIRAKGGGVVGIFASGLKGDAAVIQGGTIFAIPLDVVPYQDLDPAAFLERARPLYQALADDGVDMPDYDVVANYCAREIVDLAMRFVPDRAPRARALCQVLLPGASDWRESQRAQRAVLASMGVRLTAPVGNRRLRDAYLAGVELREAELCDEPGTWLGDARMDGGCELRMPAGWQMPVFESSVLEHVPRALARQIKANVLKLEGELADEELYAVVNSYLAAHRKDGSSRYLVLEHERHADLAAAFEGTLKQLLLVRVHGFDIPPEDIGYVIQRIDRIFSASEAQ